MYDIVTRSKNLIPFPYVGTFSKFGANVTVSQDGTITVNGTISPTTGGDYMITNLCTIYNLEVGKTYTLSGCPEGGDYGATYSMYASITKQNGTSSAKHEEGSGVTFTIPEDVAYVRIWVYFKKGYIANNLVFKPMLNEGDTALPFEPYIQRYKVVHRSKNLMPFPYNALETNKCLSTDNNGVITANGESTYSWAILSRDMTNLEAGKTYTLSGCPKTDTTTKYYCLRIEIHIGDTTVVKKDFGDGVTFEMPEYDYYNSFLEMKKGYICNYLTFKPMLNEGDTALSFEPYIQRYRVAVKENLIDVDSMLNSCLVKNDDGSYTFTRLSNNRYSKYSSNSLPQGEYVVSVELTNSTDITITGAILVFQFIAYDGNSNNTAGIASGADIGQGVISKKFSLKQSMEKFRLVLQHTLPAGATVTFKNLRLYRIS